MAMKPITPAAVEGARCVNTAFPADAVPAMAYVCYQLDRTAYAPDKALQKGTLFTVLDKPFHGKGMSE